MKKQNQNGLSNFIHQKHVVKHYSLQPQPSHSYPNLYHHQHPHFYEDEIFGELEKKSIVESYLASHRNKEDDDFMDVEEPDVRMEEQEPYEDFFAQEKGFLHKDSRNMLDSDSSGRELPSRKSSISSIESQPEKDIFSPLLIRSQVLQNKSESFIKPSRIQAPEERKAKVRREIDSSAQRRQRESKIKKIQETGCNCKKSKCLKMYCECFNLQILCGENCNCVDCGNMSQNEHHQKAVLDALTRNPKAFAEDAQAIKTTFQLGLDLSEVKKGCKCRKTQCRKKYCECFNSGQPCGVFCQCEGCANTASPR